MKVRIETPKYSFVKRNADGGIDYISPFPCPFNYGSAPGTLADDGDECDAVVLGERLAFGECVERELWAVVDFYDDGHYDPKLICSDKPLTGKDKFALASFFAFFAIMKWAFGKVKRKKGKTKFVGIRYEPPFAMTGPNGKK